MQQRYLYTDSLYEYKLEIIFTDSVFDALKSLYKRWKLNTEPLDSTACTVSCLNEETDEIDIHKYALIFDINNLTNNVISHECLHLSTFILNDRNIDLEGGNNDYENLAWLIGHLVEIVYQLVNKNKYTIKPPVHPPKISKK